MSKLSNALDMLSILSNYGMHSRQYLSETLEISPRAVQRLKDDLELAGYEITSHYGPNGGYRLENKSQIKPRAFDSEEIRVLKQALLFLQKQDLSGFDSKASTLIASLANQLDDYDYQVIEHYQSIKLNVDPKLYHAHIRALEDAISSHRRIKISYQKNHRQRNEYRFEPYNLVIVNKFWYLVGNESGTGRYLSLKINRMVSIEVEDSTFRFDQETSRKSVVSDFGYKIKPTYLKCRISNRDYISEYIWGENQRIEWKDDHTFELSLTFPNEHAAKDFVLQNGASLKILEPESMIAWHKEELLKIMSQYTLD